MDRDRSANIIDAEDTESSATGWSDTGESGEKRGREERAEDKYLDREEQDLDERKDANKGVN